MTKKRSTPKKHITTNSTHILLKKSLLVYSMLVFITFALVVFVAGSILLGAEARASSERKQRITKIYENLKLGDGYRIDKVDIFGDKRPYDWDKSRSFSSSITYGHQASVSETFADLKKHIEGAGFTQIKGPNYGTTAPARQDHYKSDKGEYMRVSIETKAWHDAMVYGTAYPAPKSPEMTETGPVYATIKVNLDDNNE